MPNAFFSDLFDEENKKENYLIWESIVLALFENFKFNYEILGTSQSLEYKNDVHPYTFLKELKSYELKDFYFHEKSHVHFNSFIGYGNKFTSYPMGKIKAFHHFTLETYQFIWYTPLLYISNWQETFPLLFSTENNYFLESCNSVFLEGGQYLKNQNYPILCPMHKNIFSVDYFKKIKLPAPLLLKNFSVKIDGLHMPEQPIKTMNFCLKIFQEAVLIQSALMEIFGKSGDQEKRLKYLQENWNYSDGKKIKNISFYRLNILSFLYLSMHPAATVLCYGLYRNKYGVAQSHRTAFYVKYKREHIALKDFLKEQVQSYINLLNEYLLKNDKINNKISKEIKEKIIASLDLARMYGIGYETNKEKGVNIHRNVPKEFRPSEVSASLRDINFIVEHNENSPFWKIFYDYCGEWWNKKEIEQILVGKGPHWEKLKISPRSMAVHIFHKYAAYFWRENLKNIKLPENVVNLIKQRYCKILGVKD